MSLNVHFEWDIRFVTTNYTGGEGGGGRRLSHIELTGEIVNKSS